jgi:hypothetical protein
MRLSILEIHPDRDAQTSRSSFMRRTVAIDLIDISFSAQAEPNGTWDRRGIVLLPKQSSTPEIVSGQRRASTTAPADLGLVQVTNTETALTRSATENMPTEAASQLHACRCLSPPRLRDTSYRYSSHSSGIDCW